MRMNPIRKAQLELRRKQVAANVLAGLTLTEIADALSVSYATIKRDWAVVQQRWQDDQIHDRQQALSTDLRRLDRALNAIWEAVQSGNLSAIDRLVKILERRARLLGLETLPGVDPATTQELGTLRAFLTVVQAGLGTLAEAEESAP